MSREAVSDPGDPAVRASGIGSSDAPIIMGCSPYKTRHQLWLEKTGQVKQPAKTWAMREGHAQEVHIREAYELETGYIMNPAEVRASAWHFSHLDGLSTDRRIILECKFVGESVLDRAMVTGEYPQHFMPQLQHQLYDLHQHDQAYSPELLTSALALGDKRGRLHIITVLPDPAYWEQLLREERAFWRLVTSGTPPEVDPLADVDERDDPEWRQAAELYKIAVERLDEDRRIVEEARQALLSLVRANKTAGWGVTVTRCNGPAGRINYNHPDIKARLAGLDLDAYRGEPGQPYYKITLGEESVHDPNW
jgi:putative phage-type endonuclease